MLFDSYQKRKRENEISYVKLLEINMKPDEEYQPKVSFKYELNEKHVPKQLANISDEEGMKRAKLSPEGIYQYYNKLYVYGTRDRYDVIDDVLIPLDYSLEVRRGKAAEAAILGHREIDTVVGYSMGGNVALALQENIRI